MLIKLDLVGIQFFPALSCCETDFPNAFLLLLKAVAELQRTSGFQIAATAKHLGNLVVGCLWVCLGFFGWLGFFWVTGLGHYARSVTLLTK